MDSFPQRQIQGSRGIPSWNLSLVLHQLTKALFEALAEALPFFKSVFLLALGLVKRRSEIRAWQNKNIRLKSPPSPHQAFFPRTCWVPISSQSTALLVEQDLRPQAEQGVGFVTFKKGPGKDISSAIMSWIKQSLILCYELSDLMTLYKC